MKKALLIAALLFATQAQADELNYNWNTGRYTIKNTYVDRNTGNKSSDSYIFGEYISQQPTRHRYPVTNNILNAPNSFGPLISEQNRYYGR